MRSGFFNNTFVTVEDFAHFAGGILSNGVLMETGAELEVSPGTSGMEFTVGTGYCWINGRYGQAENTETVSLSNGDGVNPRKDRVTVRLDLDSGTVALAVSEGVPSASPAAPDLIRSGSVYELGLAVIDVPAGAISAGACTVIDTRRDTAVCGGVFPNVSDAVVWPSANIIGEIRIFAGTDSPDRWLFCRGQEVSRSTYPDLFSVLGYTYGGSGDMFGLPDLRTRFPRGVDPDSSSSAENTPGRKGGSSSVTLTVSEMPSHSHTLSGLTGTVNATKLTAVEPGYGSDGVQREQSIATPGGWTVGDGTISGLSGSVGDTGGGQPFSILPRYINLNYIIYTGVSAV